MIQLTVSGDTQEELVKGLEKALAIVAGKTPSAASIAAGLNANEEARLRADATVVKPGKADKTKDSKAKDKDTAKETGKDEGGDADDALGDGDEDDALGGEAEAVVTREDAHKLLVEVKDKYASEPTTISEIVKKFGVKKFTDIPDAKMGEVAKVAKEYLAKATKKSGKK